ncbi:MAG: DUF1207 domain-containing protein [Gemmatimonadales bacterium]|nr:DUF1207 domain-containing protein [Gemmatimonadales bacterium]
MLGLGGALLAPAVGQAQGSRFFPDVPSFEYPAAAPRATAFVGRVVSIQEADNGFGEGTEAEAGVGETFSLIALRRGNVPITLGFGVEAYARFSLSDSKSSLISTDWVVGIDVGMDFGRWRTTLRVYHESSHLGDEYAGRFNVSRLDWTREVLEAWVRYTTGPWSFIGSGSMVLVDELDLERPGAMLAVDYRGGRFSLLGERVQPVAGLHFETMAATDWRINTSARLGVEFSGASGTPAFGLSLIAHEGLSTQRQFFRSENGYLGMEIRFDF